MLYLYSRNCAGLRLIRHLQPNRQSTKWFSINWSSKARCAVINIPMTSPWKGTCVHKGVIRDHSQLVIETFLAESKFPLLRQRQVQRDRFRLGDLWKTIKLFCPYSWGVWKTVCASSWLWRGQSSVCLTSADWRKLRWWPSARRPC